PPGLREVSLGEGWRRLLGARPVTIARQFLAALNVEVIGRGEHGHARALAISEGRYERRRTAQRPRLLLGLRHDFASLRRWPASLFHLSQQLPRRIAA